ncbi:methyl-accepting chemotaxis protein [Acetobacter sp.]|jgi:methyl-accepting chemotaxis protein|uniref:methyl-accepting chemotaxis protein n=1 Tax=Acetobacter sp. TaxID=440 RepID=UPI0025C4D489|nr:HAMP domain-containing methyl-accepting chemotaxis protein [Acetobacter sp.]MCH4091027.1 methyl-accepting chemotaxis protein [Acetobacter sp.]MCI1300210.1 methyl-accepting chemotaxis protein [Acetobacter sp.]MCI1316122.1 methyl-accepting chemotaxis protein [Acetobacter sp.]
MSLHWLLYVAPARKKIYFVMSAPVILSVLEPLVSLYWLQRGVTPKIEAVMIAASAVQFLFFVWLTYILVRAMAVPLEIMTSTTEKIASGDLDVVISYQQSQDCIGRLAKALTRFRDQALERARLQREALAQSQAAAAKEKEFAAKSSETQQRTENVMRELMKGMKCLASGDLSFRHTEKFIPEYETFREDFNTVAERFSSTIGRAASSASTIADSCAEIALASDDLARRTEHQAGSLGEISSAVNTLTQRVQKTARDAMDARTATGGAREQASESASVVQSAVKAMHEIEESSTKVADILGVMDEIAFQTNLLALNAGVEAARAGEAGRGFAVVATEVRSLAQRSAVSAKNIKELISLSSRQVSSGVTLVTQTGIALTKISENVETISEIIDSISSSAQEQADSLGRINGSLGEMDQATQQNAAMVEETTAASHSLTHEVQDLAKAVSEFSLSKNFVKNMGETAKSTRSLQVKTGTTSPALTVQNSAAVTRHTVSDDGWEDF